MAIVWRRQGKVTKREFVVKTNDKGCGEVVSAETVLIGHSTLACNTETGIVGTIGYHRFWDVWVLEICAYRDIQNMTRCDLIATEKSKDRLELIGVLKNALEQPRRALEKTAS